MNELLIAVLPENKGAIMLSFISGVVVTCLARQAANLAKRSLTVRTEVQSVLRHVDDVTPKWLETIARRLVFVLICSMLAPLKLMILVPYIRRTVDKKLEEMSPDLRTDHLTWMAVALISGHITFDLFKRARQGRQAYNARLHALGGDTVRLLELARPGRPLVVNVGSCS